MTPLNKFAYMQTLNRMKLFSLVHKEFESSNKTISELAISLGKTEKEVADLMGSPGEWTLDIVSDLLMAIGNKEIDYQVRDVQFRD